MSQSRAGHVFRQVFAQLKWVLNDNLSIRPELLVERTSLTRLQHLRRQFARLEDLFVKGSAHIRTDDFAGEWEAHEESEELQQ